MKALLELARVGRRKWLRYNLLIVVIVSNWLIWLIWCHGWISSLIFFVFIIHLFISIRCLIRWRDLIRGLVI